PATSPTVLLWWNRKVELWLAFQRLRPFDPGSDKRTSKFEGNFFVVGVPETDIQGHTELVRPDSHVPLCAWPIHNAAGGGNELAAVFAEAIEVHGRHKFRVGAHEVIGPGQEYLRANHRESNRGLVIDVSAEWSTAVAPKKDSRGDHIIRDAHPAEERTQPG